MLKLELKHVCKKSMSLKENMNYNMKYNMSQKENMKYKSNITQKKPVSKAKSQNHFIPSDFVPNPRAYTYENLINCLHYLLQFHDTVFYSQQFFANLIGVERKSITRTIERLRNESDIFIVGDAQQKYKSYKKDSVHITYSPLYKSIQSEYVPLLTTRKGMLIPIPSIDRHGLTKTIVRKMNLNRIQQAKLEAYPSWVLQKAWYQMRKLLFVKKRFYCSAWNYFNTILDVISGAKRLTLKKQKESVASFALYYQKLVSFAQEKIRELDAIWKRAYTPCDADALPNQNLYWSDYEYDYRQ